MVPETPGRIMPQHGGVSRLVADVRAYFTGWRLVGAGLVAVGVAGVVATLAGWYPA